MMASGPAALTSTRLRRDCDPDPHRESAFSGPELLVAPPSSSNPPEGLGSRLDQMNACLEANCGADAWAITPSGIRGVVND
jgi:hypothetical protein